ncbi:MAG: hypothetical protein M1822_004071 [Bathelium mastoideum]|nr:MAG: hypothetical protein M1822_004071 [Bathelium mastoideum]
MTATKSQRLKQQQFTTVPELVWDWSGPQFVEEKHHDLREMSYSFDNTGQFAPHGAEPHLTVTRWEDEDVVCFMVQSRGIKVARREDNHMINGTKLLEVAGMTRSRRDGILGSEKARRVVKYGPLDMEGTWIPFERALDFANKEKITDSLFPLFVHDIGTLLYHPSNQVETGASSVSALSGVELLAPPSRTAAHLVAGRPVIARSLGLHALPTSAPTNVPRSSPMKCKSVEYHDYEGSDTAGSYSPPLLE